MLYHMYNLNKFINKEALSGLILFVVTVLAVTIANSNLGESYFELWNLELGVTGGGFIISMNLTHWINDGLMALFFLMVGLEIKREFLLGELKGLKKSSFPIVAAIGGMMIPATFYLLINPDNYLGFGIPMATDIAFALGILMLLGKRVNTSLKLFLVSLAVVDDLGAVLVIAIFYTDDINLIYMFYSILTYSLIWILHFFKIKKLLPYLLLGILLWIFIYKMGIHATMAGILLAFAIPIQSKINDDDFLMYARAELDMFENHVDKTPLLNSTQINSLEGIAYGYDNVQNPLVRLEHNLHNLIAFFILPLFAFSNAGVILNFSNVWANLNIVIGVMMGLILGKPIGIFGFTYLATKFKLIEKPENIDWNQVLAVGFLGGIGFTMSILITQLAFYNENIIDAIKIGVFLASFISAVIGIFLILKPKSKKKKILISRRHRR